MRCTYRALGGQLSTCWLAKVDKFHWRRADAGVSVLGVRTVRLQGAERRKQHPAYGDIVQFVKSFGRRQAYESPRGRNPRTTGRCYGDFDLRLMRGVGSPQPESGSMATERPLRFAPVRL